MAACCFGAMVDALQWREHKKCWSPMVPSEFAADDLGRIQDVRSYSIFDMVKAEGSPNEKKNYIHPEYFQ